MDRTNEFRSMLGSKPAVFGNAVDQTARQDGQELAARAGFNSEAARIGQEIHIAQLKLDEVGKCMYRFCSGFQFIQWSGSGVSSTIPLLG